MTNPGGAIKIGIFGHVGNTNLGDEAIIDAVIQSIKFRYPNAEIYGFTLNPIDTSERHKIAAFPIRRIDKVLENANPHNQEFSTGVNIWLSTLLSQIKIRLKSYPLLFSTLRRFFRLWHILGLCIKEPGFLLQCYRNLNGIDLLIIAGSQQLIDYVAGGPWGHPYTIFKWILIAKANKVKVAFVSCGVGPIQTKLGRFFIRSSLSFANYRSFRDELSRKYVDQLGCSGKNYFFPDLAYSLCISKIATYLNPPIHQHIVGINLVPFFDSQGWIGGGTSTYKIYIEKLATFALWLIQRGYTILFFPTQLRADPPVIEDVRKLMYISNSNIGKNIIDFQIHSFNNLIFAISITDVIVATRFHGIIIPYLLNKPVLGIAYADKTNALMEQMDQREYALDILKLDSQSMQERFVSFEFKKEENKRKIAQRLSDHRKALDFQYDQIFKLFGRH